MSTTLTPEKKKAALTGQQQRIYDYIRNYIQQNGYPPAIRDIGTAFGIVSPNGVMCHLRALQKKGYIQRDEKNDVRGGRARAITIPGVTSGGFSLPLLGVVSAGKTIEAVEQDDRLEMKDLFGQDGLYVLKVRGTSMIESQIADGDFVIIKKQDQARDGQIVAVRDEDGEATLKKIYRDRSRVRLEPANRALKPIFRDHVDILGVLVGVVRKY